MKCCICGKDVGKYGNNPEPASSEGICCDDCNFKIVLPMRLKRMKGGNKNG